MKFISHSSFFHRTFSPQLLLVRTKNCFKTFSYYFTFRLAFKAFIKLSPKSVLTLVKFATARS